MRRTENSGNTFASPASMKAGEPLVLFPGDILATSGFFLNRLKFMQTADGGGSIWTGKIILPQSQTYLSVYPRLDRDEATTQIVLHEIFTDRKLQEQWQIKDKAYSSEVSLQSLTGESSILMRPYKPSFHEKPSSQPVTRSTLYFNPRERSVIKRLSRRGIKNTPWDIRFKHEVDKDKTHNTLFIDKNFS